MFEREIKTPEQVGSKVRLVRMPPPPTSEPMGIRFKKMLDKSYVYEPSEYWPSRLSVGDIGTVIKTFDDESHLFVVEIKKAQIILGYEYCEVVDQG